ncbi:uncharacterized protein LOC144887812 [Branchiostoma floridae x Branchiostoma japonicum]
MSASLVLNILVTVAVVRGRRGHKTNHSLLILNLTMSGLVLTVVGMPLSLMSVFDGGAVLNGLDSLCSVNGFVSVFLALATTLSLSAIAVDRYLAICKATKYKAILTPCRLNMALIAIWIVSAIGGLPPVFGWAEFEYDPATYHCSPAWQSPHGLGYRIFCLLVGFILPITVMLVCYTLIFITVRRSNRRVASLNEQNNAIGRPLENGTTGLKQLTRTSSIRGERPSKYHSEVKLRLEGEESTDEGRQQETVFAIKLELRQTSEKNRDTETSNEDSDVDATGVGPLQSAFLVNTSSKFNSEFHSNTEFHVNTEFHDYTDFHVLTAFHVNAVSRVYTSRVYSAFLIIKEFHADTEFLVNTAFHVNTTFHVSTEFHVDAEFHDNTKFHVNSEFLVNTKSSVCNIYSGCIGGTVNNAYMNKSDRDGLTAGAASTPDHLSPSPSFLERHFEERRSVDVPTAFRVSQMRRDRDQQRKERKVAITGAMLVLAYITCWGPYAIINIQSTAAPLWVYTLAMWLGYANCVVSPVVYALTNRHIMQEIRTFCTCRQHAGG